MDADRTTEQMAVASLRPSVNWMVLNHWARRAWWLRGVPVLDGGVDAWLERGLEFPVLSGTLQVVQPVLIAEPHQPLSVAAQRFGKATRRS